MLPGKLFDRMQFCFKQPLHSKKHFDTLYLFESWITITPHKDGTLSWSSCAHFEGLFEIYLRAAAPAADTGRIGKEATRIGLKLYCLMAAG